MVPLKIFRNGRIHDIKTDDFSNGVIELCDKHREAKRALAFAFIIYDFCNPQITKVLDDADYWNALDAVSGKFLSIYYIPSRESIFEEDLAKVSDLETREMHPINAGVPFNKLLPMLKTYLALDNDVKLPSILFFQVEGKLISDYFLIELSEESIEKAFLELKDYIVAAVDRLKLIDPTNYDNYQPIFNSLKEGVKSTRLRKVVFRNVQKFPVQLLLSWFTGKV